MYMSVFKWELHIPNTQGPMYQQRKHVLWNTDSKGLGSRDYDP